MAMCPVCATPGAYIGFNSVECRNPECEHFTIAVEEVCPCCGQVGHTPTQSADTGVAGVDQLDAAMQSAQLDSSGTPLDADPS
jgi:hypothetical protein